MFDAYEAINDIIDDINEDYYESCYDAIYEELCDRVDYGEMTIEEAQMINDAAAEKYITEFNSDIKRHYDNRLAKEKLTHNHNKIFRGGGYLHLDPPNKDIKKSEDKDERESYDHGDHTKSLAYSNFIWNGDDKMKLKHYKNSKKDADLLNSYRLNDLTDDHLSNQRNKKFYEYKKNLNGVRQEIEQEIAKIEADTTTKTNEKNQGKQIAKVAAGATTKTNEKNQGKQIAKIAAGATAAAAAGALIISKSQKASIQKSFKKYISTHNNVIPFNEFKSEKITDSDIKKYAPNLVSKTENMLTVTKGKKYTYNGKVQCLYIEMRVKTRQNSGPKKSHFVLVSPICNKHDEYYTASMCYSNKVKDPMLKRFLKNNK